MLTSSLAGIACYYIIVFLCGVFVNSAAAEGTLIAFAALCFVGSYFVKSARTIHKICIVLGGATVALLCGTWFLLPLLTKQWVVIASVGVGILTYIGLRRPIHRKWLHKDREGNRIRAPWGKEWARWLLAFLL